MCLLTQRERERAKKKLNVYTIQCIYLYTWEHKTNISWYTCVNQLNSTQEDEDDEKNREEETNSDTHKKPCVEN